MMSSESEIGAETEANNGVQNQHYAFGDIYSYVSSKRYPDNIKDKGQKANFRRAANAFSVTNGKLLYAKKEKDGSRKQVITFVMAHPVYHF